jgi:hypothetical protein
MEGAAGSRHALGTLRAGQKTRVRQNGSLRAASLDRAEAGADRDRDAAGTHDAGELAAAMALVAGGASRWVMVCGLHDAGSLLESTVPSIDAAVRLRRTAPDTILVTGVDAPADLRPRAGKRRSRGLLHAVLAVAARVVGE